MYHCHISFDRAFGGITSDGDLQLFSYSAKSKRKISVSSMQPTSLGKPAVNNDGSMVVSTNTGSNIYQLNFDGKNVSAE